MSNKIVPATYRAIIDDVIANIKSEFDDYGVSEEVLGDLQSRWENKVIASHVAEFEAPQQTMQQSAPPHHYPPHVSHPSLQQIHPAYQYVQTPTQPQVKSEPVDNRFPISTNLQTYIPTLPGPTLPGPTLPRPPQMSTTQTYTPPSTNGAPRQPYSHTPVHTAPSSNSTSQPRIPQVDGSYHSDSESPSPPPSSFAPPRASHPSLPQPPPKPVADTEEINSDLDDSDTDGEEEDAEGALGETDIMFCTYDKVARVKNKWKCVLKDGMIHVNGKDYLFGKCTCEFEW